MPRRNEEGESQDNPTGDGAFPWRQNGWRIGHFGSWTFLSILVPRAHDPSGLFFSLPVSEHAQNTRSIFFSQTDLSDLMMSQ